VNTSTRQAQLTLRLATDSSEQVQLIRAEGHEALSEHFSATLEVMTLEDVELLANLGLPACVELFNDGEHARYFHGMVVDFRSLAYQTETGWRYEVELAPKAYFHQFTRAHRMFQEMSPVDIIEETLNRCNIPYRMNANGARHQLLYCVQYGESDFDFVCRIMEEQGLYYYYEHSASDHTMVICDAPGSHVALSKSEFWYNPSSRSFSAADSAAHTDGHAFITQWHERASSGAERDALMRDFDFMSPDEPVSAEFTDDNAHEGDDGEIYAFPGRFFDPAVGENLVKAMLQARRAMRRTFDAHSAYVGMQAGYKFTLLIDAAAGLDHSVSRSTNQDFLIIANSFQASSEGYRTGMSGSGHGCRITAIPAETQFRAPQVTPRPVARGPETAIVTGPSGEEIYVDEYARIKVQFHWDRDGRRDDRSSCWIRVSQTGGLGNIVHPRIGQEVIVDFLHGNPDRPIVTGRVYNAQTMPHYALPGDKTKAVWRSKTYKRDSGETHAGAKDLDTGKPGANEIMMEDATGEEEFYIHAEKDLKVRVRNEETHHVGKDQEINIMVNRTETVGENDDITIGNDRTTVIGNDHSEQVGNNQTIDVGNNQTITVMNKIAITANMEIKLTCGASTITMGPSSISIVSPQVDIKAMGSATMVSPNTEVKGFGMLTLMGGLVKIN
jgi:type VI secretion system secreted protein VgrG